MPTTPRTALLHAAPRLILCLLPALMSCSTDKTVENSGERFACTTVDDCVSGYQCACGFCQPIGAMRCLDASGVDAGQTDTGTPDAGSTDTGTTDAGTPPVDCDPVTWGGCPAGQGCYWDVATGDLFCRTHGSLGEGVTCDPAVIHTCGKSAAGKPLLCDAVDKRCYPLCRAGQDACKAGETCFALQDGASEKVWPKDAGICAK